MTKDQKLADDVWYYIHDWQRAMLSKDETRITQHAVRLDRALQKAIRSKAK